MSYSFLLSALEFDVCVLLMAELVLWGYLHVLFENLADMIEGYLYIFPLTVCVLIPCAYVIPSLLAVYFQHSKFELLLFSRVSSDAPESCIYSQMINLASFVLIITVYIRYRQIAELIRNNPTCGKRYTQTNLIFLICAMTATFSLSVISNFPHANVSTVRICAINVTYLSSTAALYSEMFLSIWMRPLLYSSRRMPIIRMILTGLCTVALIAFVLLQMIRFENDVRMNSNFLMVITIWIFTSLLLIYICTFILDFSRIKIVSPKIFLTNDIIDDQMNNVLALSI